MAVDGIGVHGRRRGLSLLVRLDVDDRAAQIGWRDGYFQRRCCGGGLRGTAGSAPREAGGEMIRAGNGAYAGLAVPVRSRLGDWIAASAINQQNLLRLRLD